MHTPVRTGRILKRYRARTQARTRVNTRWITMTMTMAGERSSLDSAYLSLYVHPSCFKLIPLSEIFLPLSLHFFYLLFYNKLNKSLARTTLFSDYRPLNLSPFEFFATFLPVLPISFTHPRSSVRLLIPIPVSLLFLSIFVFEIHLSSLTLTCPGTLTLVFLAIPVANFLRNFPLRFLKFFIKDFFFF